MVGQLLNIDEHFSIVNLFCNLLSNCDKDTKDNISQLVVTVSEI